MKKILGILLSVVLLFTFAACDKGGNGDPQQLSAPANVRLTEGVIYWDEVPNAQSYVITYNEEEHTETATSHTVTPVTLLQSEFAYSVVAKAEGYLASQPATGIYTPTVNPEDVAVSITGKTVVGSGQQTTYKAVVTGINIKDYSVTWSITQGSQYASISATGEFKAEQVTEQQQVVIKAVSNADPSAAKTLTISIQPKPQLTQAMLDVFSEPERLYCLGDMDIEVYSKGLTVQLVNTLHYNLETYMDGTDWYAEYEDMLGASQGLYAHNNNGVASNVNLSFMNVAEYTDILDDSGNELSWADSGYYNNFHGANLTTADFEFDDEEWRYMYKSKGDGDTFMERVVASCNPYNFTPVSLGLDISNGVIMGIYSASTRDRGVVAGYDALMYMYVDMIEMEPDEKVPTIFTFSTHPGDGENPGHKPLADAIANMKALNNYTVSYFDISSNAYIGGQTYSGYVEKITADHAAFEDFTADGNYNKTFTGSKYGFKKIDDNLYNQYRLIRPAAGDPYYEAQRAYAESFDTAKPGFNFAAEIFTSYSLGDDGSITYYANDAMQQVATEFYKSVGNDSAMLGIFAAQTPLDNSIFGTNVTVKDGYITEASFYYYAGLFWGVLELEYYDFNTTEITEEVTFETRALPADWSSFMFYSGGSTEEEVPATQVFAENFAGMEIPFFNTVLGDTFGFGAVNGNVYRPSDSRKTYNVLLLYYDVPLDLNYTLTSSYDAVHNFLTKQCGFKHNGNFEYRKDNLGIKVTEGEDEGSQGSLDFQIYIWKYTD